MLVDYYFRCRRPENRSFFDARAFFTKFRQTQFIIQRILNVPTSEYTTRDPSPRLASRWERRALDETAAANLARQLGLPPLVARILTARGLSDPDEAGRFLKPLMREMHDPMLLKGMAEACQRIGQAIDAGEKITIFGDYDVDGTTATAILLLTLRQLGAQADYHIPHRLNDGYGLRPESIEFLADEGARLVITVDCGINAVEEAQLASQRGIDLIITDHHEPGPETPEACAVINPRQNGCSYPYKDLAGAGVAFKLAHALLKQRHPDATAAREFLKSLLDLAALGTVADIVPMTGENRVMVTHGLERLRQTRRPGLDHLIRNAGLKAGQLQSGHISFALGPRLNAAGRTEHAAFSVELLITDNDAQAVTLAHQLEDFNMNRREIEQVILEEALELITPYLDDKVLVVAQDGWHSGVTGIVASRILNLFNRPTMILSIDGGRAKGSGRSIKAFDLHAGLTHCEGMLTRFGGHKMAAGMEIETRRIDEFRAMINDYASGLLSIEDLRPVVTIDTVADPGDLTPVTVEMLESLAPHGPANPKPVLALENYELIDSPRVMKQRHLKLNLVGPEGQALAALGWNMADRLAEIPASGGPIRLSGTPYINAWNGRTSVEFEIKDFQVT